MDDHLTVAQHTQLILTLLHSLSCPKPVDCDLAACLLLMVFEDHSIKPEQVGLRQGLLWVPDLWREARLRGAGWPRVQGCAGVCGTPTSS